VAASCPRCDARWTGLKVEHCSVCHLTFSSTRAGDRHLTREQMLALRRENGEPWYAVRVNAYGVEVFGRHVARSHWFAPQLESVGRTGLSAREGSEAA
jgi:hypothetical protein